MNTSFEIVKYHFQNTDPILHSLIKPDLSYELKKSENYFRDLVESIINQQLSEKAGTTIMNRFLALFPNHYITPNHILSIPEFELRKAGMSSRKVSYVKNLAELYMTNKIPILDFPDMKNDDVLAHLVSIRGIGQWTAEMFLMFSLGREDIFSIGDAGLRRAIMREYDFENQHEYNSKITELSNKWSPYRTYACKILWRSL